MLLSIILPSSQTAAGDAFAGLIVLLSMIIVWRVRKYPHKLSSYGIVFALFLCLVHYVFPGTSGDFQTYKEFVEGSGFINTNIIAAYYEHFERVYYVIVNFVHNDYFLFRLVVWGGSLVFFCLTAIRLKIDFNTFIFFFCISVAPLTSTSRVSLVYAIAFYGFSFIVEPITRKGSNILSFIFGAILIWVSLFFHRSAIFLLLTLPLCLIDFNKKILKLLPFVFVIIVIVLNTNLFNYIIGYNQTDDSLFDAQTAYLYLTADKKEFGVGHLVRLGLRYCGIFAVGYLIVKCILNRSYSSWPKPVRRFAIATLIITVISTAFLCTSGNTYKTFERLTGFSVFPRCILLAYLLKIGFEKKLVNTIIYFLAGYVVYDTIYELFYLGGVGV
jgi:hypothetical protein